MGDQVIQSSSFKPGNRLKCLVLRVTMDGLRGYKEKVIAKLTGALQLAKVPKRMLVLGGGIVGTHAGDMIGEIALAIEMGADAVDIGKTIHPHPTLGESIGMAAEVAHGSCTDVPRVRK